VQCLKPAHMPDAAQQVSKQIWLSTRFGVITERPLSTMRKSCRTDLILTPYNQFVKFIWTVVVRSKPDSCS
jgi:hypothetical protein